MIHRMLIAGVIVATTACSGARNNGMRDSAAGNVAGAANKDSAINNVSATTPSVSPLVHVTKTDGKSVAQATKYEITEANLRRFMAVSESLSVVAARFPSVKSIADNPNLTGAGSPDANAGLKLLESNTAVNTTINSQGMSVPDFYVMSIAIASAERFMNDPKAAPPTPALAKNAELLKRHEGDLMRLQALNAGPAVTTTP